MMEPRDTNIDAPNEARILGIGTPVMEICAQIALGYLDRWGLLENEWVKAENMHSDLLEEVMTYFRTLHIPSGSTLNVLRIFQWFSRNRNRTTLYGRVGTDELGRQLQLMIKRSGIETKLNMGTG